PYGTAQSANCVSPNNIIGYLTAALSCSSGLCATHGLVGVIILTAYIQHIFARLTCSFNVGQESLLKAEACLLSNTSAVRVAAADTQLNLDETTVCQGPIRSDPSSARGNTTPPRGWCHTIRKLNDIFGTGNDVDN